MALKNGKKKKQLGNTNLNNITRPWPHLPDQLVRLIEKQPNLIQHISFGGVSKTWRAASRQYCNRIQQSPWLQLSEPQGTMTRHVLTIPLGMRLWHRYWRRRPSQEPQYFVCGSSHGKLVMIGATPSNFALYNIDEKSSRTLLPSWDANVAVKHAVLSASPFTYNCTVLVLTVTAGGGSLLYFYTRSAGRLFAWIKEDCSLIDPNSLRTIQFTNVIGFEGKFYALSLHGTLAVIDVDSHPRVTILGARRAVPNCVGSRSFREYLVESCGEILLVFLISRKSINRVDDVEVFRLHLSKLLWIKMESLGDHTLFVGLNCCMSVSASHELGCRGNSIYFTHNTDDGWWVFDMNGAGITPCFNADSTKKSPVWMDE